MNAIIQAISIVTISIWILISLFEVYIFFKKNEYAKKIKVMKELIYTQELQKIELPIKLASKAPEMLEMLEELIYAFEGKNLHTYQEERLEEAKQLIKEATEL